MSGKLGENARSPAAMRTQHAAGTGPHSIVGLPHHKPARCRYPGNADSRRAGRRQPHGKARQQLRFPS